MFYYNSQYGYLKIIIHKYAIIELINFNNNIPTKIRNMFLNKYLILKLL